MVEIDDNDDKFNPKPLFKIYDDEKFQPQKAALVYLNHRSSSMRRSIRALFSAVVLLVVLWMFSCRFAVHSGFGAMHSSSIDKGSESVVLEGSDGVLDFPLFNSTLLMLSEIEPGEERQKREIQQLLDGNLVGQSQYRVHFMTWFGVRNVNIRTRFLRGKVSRVNLRSPMFSWVWSGFRTVLNDWVRKKGFESGIMDELIDLVKVPIDRNNGLDGLRRRKYSSCAAVGNSGILLSNEHGELIDSHEVVIRLNNAKIEGFKHNVGSKTSISFINSNILHTCSRKDACPCHPYGPDVPIVMYICQPVHFLDYTVCNSSHRAPLLVTDPRFDVLAARLIKYYSLKRFANQPNETLAHWSSVHDGAMFHYSSGMQAVMLALGTCDRVSLFGFGKSSSAKHHYHTSQKKELGLHDYEAEYDFYQDLVQRPQVIPFISKQFKFPPVEIHR